MLLSMGAAHTSSFHAVFTASKRNCLSVARFAKTGDFAVWFSLASPPGSALNESTISTSCLTSEASRRPVPAPLRTLIWGVIVIACTAAAASGQAAGSGAIRGLLFDDDFDAPLPAATVTILETGAKAESTDQGNYALQGVPAGSYTVIVAKEGYVRQIKSDVIVTAGQLTDLNFRLSGEFTDMAEFIVQDLQIGGGDEAALLELRFESPALLDSVGADLMSRAGASDAAAALKLVSGATVQDGKFAVIRGLPDRFVSSQMNGVRLPTADEDKRAVELDQFPATVIESIQVSKTFTPDQQGDASGGAVDVRLKGIPEENTFQVKFTGSYNTNVQDGDFLSYDGGGLNTWGIDDGGRDPQLGKLGGNWDGAVGVSPEDNPDDWKFEISGGGKHEADGYTIGASAAFFYERDSSFFDDGIDDSLWVRTPGEPLVPKNLQGGLNENFFTALYDVTEAAQSVQWGGLGLVGIETERNTLDLTYLYTRTAEDKAILAEDTRGKKFFFPGYDPDDPTGTGNGPNEIDVAPFIRTETLEYTERETETLQLHGTHVLPTGEYDAGPFRLLEPEIDWTLSNSSANFNQPDKRLFGQFYQAPSFNPGFPPFGIPSFTTPATWFPFKPAANFNLGNLQRIFKEINEESDQYSVSVKLPFEQWTGTEGFVEFGMFDDQVERTFDQESFSNFGDAAANFQGGFDTFWSEFFPFENHPITASEEDVDYDGEQSISAWYGMVDMPLSETFKVITGARFEKTDISTIVSPDDNAVYFPQGAVSPVSLDPGDPAANASISEDDVLPSFGFVYEPDDEWTFRGSWAETIARPTFKELTPILQQEFLGGPVFIGNAQLQQAAVENFDLRVDYKPYDGGLVSVSWFKKEIENPIEFVQEVIGFDFTTPVNFPEGELDGFEFEVRQDLGHFWKDAEGISVGANATIIESEVQLPQSEIDLFASPALQVPQTSRDMTNAPERLLNFFVTYDIEHTGTQMSLFYTITGDTLIAGAGESGGNFVPDVYRTEFGQLNFSLSQELSENATLKFAAKNLTDPDIETVYRSDFIGSDVLKTSFSRGREFSLGVTVRF